MSMIVEFRFDSWYKPGDDLQKLIDIVGQDIEIDDDGTIKGWNTYRGDLKKLLFVTNKFELERESSSWVSDLVEKVENIEHRLFLYSQEQQFNSKCSVHVPGFALMEIQQVKAENDYCTDMLTQDLQDGWRILAICPQPDQRRPDYILGKSK